MLKIILKGNINEEYLIDIQKITYISKINQDSYSTVYIHFTNDRSHIKLSGTVEKMGKLFRILEAHVGLTELEIDMSK